jgi:hypothetical protein
VNVTVDAASALRVANSHHLFTEGVITSHGTIFLDAFQYGTVLNAFAPTNTYAGSGAIVLSDSPNNFIYTTTGGATLTLNLTGGLRGAGQLGYNSLFVTNNTTITAQGANPLVIDPPASGFDNNGTLAADAGARLTLLNGTFDNAQGRLAPSLGGTARLSGAALVGGVIDADGPVFMDNNSTLDAVTIEPGSVVALDNSQAALLRNTITNRGTLRSDAAQFGTVYNIQTPTVTLAGTGELVLSNSPNNIVYSSLANARLVNHNTIRGAGQIGYNALAVTNRGTIRAEGSHSLILDPPAGADAFVNDTGGLVHASGANITLQPGVFRNLGTVRVNAGRLFHDAGDPFTQEAGLVRVDGELEVAADAYLLQGGTLSGTGRVDSNVTHSGGVIAPGNSAGILTIEGSLTQQPASFLDIEIGGPTPGTEHDRLVVTAAAALNGTLRISFLGGIPQNAPLTILTAASRTGAFTTIETPSGVTAVVDYTPNAVIVTLTCAGRADFNGDGFIDFFDYDDFVLCYEGILCPPGTDADINGDGFVDFFDYDDYVLAFEAGC